MLVVADNGRGFEWDPRIRLHGDSPQTGLPFGARQWAGEYAEAARGNRGLLRLGHRAGGRGRGLSW